MAGKVEAPIIRWEVQQGGMTRSKGGIFAILGLLILMTGVFTATSAETTGQRATQGAGTEEFVLVNGDAVSEEEFVARVAAVEQNVVMLRAQAEMAPEQNPLVEEFLMVMEETPAETIALASLILDVAVYQEAVRRGMHPDPAIVQQQVQQERMMFETIEEDPAQFGVAQEEVDAYRASIEAIGEDRYWSEFFPQLIEQQRAVELLQASVASQGEDWGDVQQRVTRSADVDVLNSDAIFPATAGAAQRYLDTIWRITAQF